MELVDIMKLRMAIYMALNTITGKVYIGKTAGLLGKRIKEHRYLSRNGNAYFQRSIRKHGWENFQWLVLEYDCDTEEELNDLEYHYIQQYKRFSNGVYNMTDGGDGMSGWVPSEEWRRKKSEASKGRTPNLGNKHSEETKRKMSESNLGKRHTEETKRKMSTSKVGHVVTEETKQKMRVAKCKFTYKITRPDGAIDITTNLNQYCKQNSLDSGTMHNVASGKCKQHKDYKCQKIDNILEVPVIPVQQQTTPAPTYDRTTPLMEVFFGV